MEVKPTVKTRPTMKDVANHAGVSTMSVSRALKDRSLVSEDVAVRIFEAVEALGYVLDQSAGALSSGRTGFVVALVPALNNSIFADMLNGLTEGLTAAGLQVLLGYTNYQIETEEQLIETLLRRRPEGIIVTGGRHTERSRKLLAASGIPVIETWDLPAYPIHHVVGYSNADACKALVYRLYQRGYRKFGFIGGTSNRDTRGADRRLGFLQAMDELGLPHGRTISFSTPPVLMEQGGDALLEMVRQSPDIEVAICVSDLVAFGALMACRRKGWDVPGDLAIAGFGDFEIARACVPSITTVAVDSTEIGRIAAQQVLHAIDAQKAGKSSPPETVIVPYHVIERESTLRAR